MKSVSAETIAAVQQAYSSGETYSEIKRRLHVGDSTITKHCQHLPEYGKRPSSGYIDNMDDCKAMSARFVAGESTRSLAREYGIDKGSVHRRIRKANGGIIPPRTEIPKTGRPRVVRAIKVPKPVKTKSPAIQKAPKPVKPVVYQWNKGQPGQPVAPVGPPNPLDATGRYICQMCGVNPTEGNTCSPCAIARIRGEKTETRAERNAKTYQQRVMMG